MNRNSRRKRSNWLAIDETASEGEDEDLPSMRKDPDDKFQFRSNKVASERKNEAEVPVIDLGKSKVKASTNDKRKTKDSRTTLTRKENMRSNGKTDLRREESSTNNFSETEIIIVGEDDEDIVQEASSAPKNRKRKGTGEIVTAKKAKNTQASSSRNKSSSDKTTTESKNTEVEDDEQEDSDSVVEYQPSQKTARGDKPKKTITRSDESNRKKNINEKNIRNEENLREKEKKSKRRTDTRKEQKLSEPHITLSFSDEITIDDEDAEDEGLRIENVGKNLNTPMSEVTRKRSRTQAVSTNQERFTDIDITLSSSDEITIDDEDDIDWQLETKSPVNKKRQKDPDETAAASKKAKTSKASTSKKISKSNKAGETLSPVDSENKCASHDLEKSSKNLSSVGSENDERDKDKEDNFNDKVGVEWSEPEYLSEFNQIRPEIAKNLISLFNDDNTIPFIARYRKEMTGGMEPDQLRNIKNTYDNLKLIKQRALVILRTIDKLGKWSPEIHSAVTAAKTMNELEHIFAPFKPGSKGSLAERAKELGLAQISLTILQGQAVPSLSSFIDTTRKGLKNETEVKQGIVHIIADIISKDKTTFEGIHKFRKSTTINIESTKSKAAKSLGTSKKGKDNVDPSKYETYFNFVSSEKFIKDYQILAINRGEAHKVLTVKVTIPDWFQNNLRRHCLEKYTFVRKVSNFHSNIIEESFDDAYNRLIKPLVIRQVRHDLNERAESASIEVFAGNVKKLLLIPPLRGQTILSIDPGFTHGCKLAVISQYGNVLDVATIYPHAKMKSHRYQDGLVLANLLKKHNCTIVALGNATACRETEMFLTDLIQAGAFAPLDVSYTIVNESGASVYSCSKEAKSEFPDLDPNIISAISIARRLQDPLAELIKIEPQHLGVGMYQHDLPKKQLQLTLDEVISEVVSFVGVDVNTASHCLLKKVAGLSAATATNIITRRNECGPFVNRKELLDVRRIGKKCFEQCAGFIRILPETAFGKDRSASNKYTLDYLDQTWIHPESYGVARKFLKACNCDLKELGTENFIRKVLSYANVDLKMLANQFKTSETSMDIIVKGLSMKKGEDIRVKEEGPLFRRNLRCIDDLSPNTRLTGVVTNVTNFGTFIDIGVGKAGLMPVGKEKGQTLSLGERVEVIVVSVDRQRQRIILSL